MRTSGKNLYIHTLDEYVLEFLYRDIYLKITTERAKKNLHGCKIADDDDYTYYTDINIVTKGSRNFLRNMVRCLFFFFLFDLFIL